FGSDSRLVGMMRYVRPAGGTVIGSKLFFDYPLIVTEGWGKEGKTEVPIASEPIIDYENSIAYFSWVCVLSSQSGRVGDALSHAEIYSSDGFNMKLIYKDPAEYKENIYGLYGDLKEGKIYARTVDTIFRTKVL